DQVRTAVCASAISGAAKGYSTLATLGLDAAVFEIRRTEDIAPTFEALKDRADALYVVGDALVATHRIQINAFALTGRLPITGIPGCCARAVSGHAAAPPSSDMNARRLIRSPRRRGRAAAAEMWFREQPYHFLAVEPNMVAGTLESHRKQP